MTCAEFVELVTAYLEGALDRDTEQRFLQHIAICDGCDRYLQQIGETIIRLGRLPTGEGLSGEARDRMLAAFRTWARG